VIEPFDRRAWWRYHREVARSEGWLAALREAGGRAALGTAHALAWRWGEPAPPARDVVMVVGHQRSGTTWLHRLLASHPAACAMPLHALLLPADAWQRLFDRPRPGWLDRWQDATFGPSDDLHRVRLHEAEEDEFALWVLFRSPMNTLDRPWPPGRGPEIEPDERALQFYAQAVARHVRRTGRRYVGKNPHFTWRIPALREAMPGVRVVACWRHPEVAIPSRLSLVREIWRRRGLARQLQPHHVQRIYASSVRGYLGGLGMAEVDLRYDDLVADPRAALASLHEQLGLEPWPAEVGAAMEPLLRRAPSRHRYDLAEFGLTSAQIVSDLAPVYERFGFLPRGVSGDRSRCP
jgi:hypothetical protein